MIFKNVFFLYIYQKDRSCSCDCLNKELREKMDFKYISQESKLLLSWLIFVLGARKVDS